MPATRHVLIRAKLWGALTAFDGNGALQNRFSSLKP